MINILGKKYKLNKVKEADTTGFLGGANSVKQIITIRTDLPKEQYEDTLLHEVIHIIDGELKTELTEAQVCRLAVGLFSAGCRIKVNDEKS